MIKRFFLALIMFLSLSMHPTEVKAESSLLQSNLATASVSDSSMDDAALENNEMKVPAKEAHENPQKWVNIILVIVFVLAIAGFITIGIIMKKSEK
ncbi:hypothetical protein DCC39_01940 [Pueribacillus theae]|uniref:Type VII secretion protein EssA n=1 Tax=Pueribacillus theae TaxID=2171751 RepID=A0A2U1K6R5_9BACI|nr:hypothetical protein [Pueribacillus theae]PWA13231.1 hypothetical protein DCC39_01940 [Pueribacillus theae]